MHETFVSHTQQFCGSANGGLFYRDAQMVGLCRPSAIPAETSTAIRRNSALEAGEFISRADDLFRPHAAGYAIICRDDDGRDRDIDMVADEMGLDRPWSNLPRFVATASVEPGDHAVETVSDHRQFERWIDIVSEAFGNEYPVAAMRQDFSPVDRILGLRRLQLLLVQLDGEYVSAGMLFSDGIAGYVSAVGTIPSARHQGCASSLIRYATNRTFELGAGYSFLFSSHGSSPTYEAIGYERAATIHHRIRMF